MSKQIAVLLDNSGSMFQPVGGSNPNTKIYETARGAEYFLENLIDALADTPDAEFAISVHRFASSYQVLPGGAQIDSSGAGFVAGLGAMRSAIAAIENEAASGAAVGVMTDLYDAVRRVSDYMNNSANQPGFGTPDSKVVFVFTDGLQTIAHGGSKTMAGYEGAESVSFENLLEGRGIKLVAWGSGSDALGAVLAELADKAVQGGTNPVSESKVLFPIDETGTFENCTTIIASNAFNIVSNNGVLPLAPAGQEPSGLLWEQFSLPRRQVVIDSVEVVATTAVFARAPVQVVNFSDFEVHVDGMTKELILGLVAHGPGRPRIETTSPSGNLFTRATAGTRSFSVANAQALKVPSPEEGIWRVRVHGDRKAHPMVMDLLARGVTKEFSLEVKAEPRQVLEPKKVEIVVWPRLEGKPAEGKLKVGARVLGGASTELSRKEDGSFRGKLGVSRPGVNIVVADVQGELAEGKTIHRIGFTVVQLGHYRDPRFTVSPIPMNRARSTSSTSSSTTRASSARPRFALAKASRCSISSC